MKTYLPSVRIVLVCGGKGGVGKSTVAARLATGLTARGCRTGLLDADLQGPSLPVLFDVRERPAVRDGRIRPVVRGGVRLMSTGLLADSSRALAWKGPLLRGALRQMVRDVDWGDVETLVIDTPPGTGEIHLALADLLDVAAAVVVTTPQAMAVEDTYRCIAMLRRLGIAVPAVVENMAYYPCPCCGARTEPFAASGPAGTLPSETGDAATRLIQLPFAPALAAGPEPGARPAAGADATAATAFAELLDTLDTARCPVP
ncbi:ATP-binding protein [Amycolatopsis sp. NPDC004747]